MFSYKIKFIFLLSLLALVSSNLFAQTNSYEVEREIDEILLKQDILVAVKEAEKSPKNDIVSLYRRLILYRRAANYPKVGEIIKQISRVNLEDKNKFNGGYVISRILEDELFQDIDTLQFYLQNYGFSESIYKKFIGLCLENKNACDVIGFDNWLGQKFAEKDKTNTYDYYQWIGYHLQWREKFGLDKAEILNQFRVEYRNNPNDLDSAIRYFAYFNNVETAREIAEKFDSKQAYENYELAGSLIHTKYSGHSKSDKEEMVRYGIDFLNKSLEIPFKDTDKQLMWQYRFRMASIPPKIGDYKKQLHYWVKTKLAETYTGIGEAEKAQPIAEEIVKMDKSDIQTENVKYLAGAVQMASGARVVENKILSEQTKREHTYEYWKERANYYRGRNELVLAFDAYENGLKTVPFELNKQDSRNGRSSFIHSFAFFTDNDFSKYLDSSKRKADETISAENKQKAILWLKAEEFLREEFIRTKSDLLYSSGLIVTIRNFDFDNLLGEIFTDHSEHIIKLYLELPADYMEGNFISDIYEIKELSDTKKEDLIVQIYNIAQSSDPKKTILLINIINRKNNSFVAQSIPVLNRNLEKIEESLKAKNLTFTQRENLGYLKEDYLDTLFSSYLKANNWKEAERFMLEKFDWSEKSFDHRYRFIRQIAETAAANEGYADAVRLWKQRANFDRSDLEGLEILSRYNAVGTDLIEFYQRMRTNEPYSPIPELALRILR